MRNSAVVETKWLLEVWKSQYMKLMRSSREVMRVEKDVGMGPGKYGRNRHGTGLAQDISNLGELNFLL